MTRRYTSLGCGADVRSSREDCPPPRDNPPSVRQSARHAGTELSPGTFSPRETYDSGFSVSAQSFNFLGSNFPITTRDWVSTHLTLSDSCPFRPTGRALADNPGPGPAVGWVRPMSAPAGRTARHPGTTHQVSGSRPGMLEQS